MALFTTKMKLILFLLLASAAIFAIYWFFIRGRQGLWGRHRLPFTIPIERIQKKVLDNGMHVLVFQNKECTYWRSNWCMLVIVLILGSCFIFKFNL